MTEIAELKDAKEDQNFMNYEEDLNMELNQNLAKKEFEYEKLEEQNESFNSNIVISRPRSISKIETILDMMFNFNELFCHKVVQLLNSFSDGLKKLFIKESVFKVRMQNTQLHYLLEDLMWRKIQNVRSKSLRVLIKLIEDLTFIDQSKVIKNDLSVEILKYWKLWLTPRNMSLNDKRLETALECEPPDIYFIKDLLVEKLKIFVATKKRRMKTGETTIRLKLMNIRARIIGKRKRNAN